MQHVKDKWNRIYAGDRAPGSVSTVLSDNTDLLPSAGIALDLACGTGVNSLYLAELGLDVHAWDISEVAIDHLGKTASDRGLVIHTRVLDITATELATESFDLIVTCHYLDRKLPPAILEATRPGGIICYQTFTANKLLEKGPSNPAFLLGDNELQTFVPGCEILRYRDESLNSNLNDPMAGQAYIVARKADRSSA